MIGKVLRPEAGVITRKEDRDYLDALFDYVNELSGSADGEPLSRVLRGYVMSYPETGMLLKSNEHPEVRTEEDIVIWFRGKAEKEAFDQYRNRGVWPEEVDPTRDTNEEKTSDSLQKRTEGASENSKNRSGGRQLEAF